MLVRRDPRDPRDRRATLPHETYADLDGETVIEPEADLDRRMTAALPIGRAELRAAAAWRPAHAAPLPRAPARFARASSPPPLAAPMAPLPRSSTALPYPLVTGLAPRALAPYAPPARPARPPAAERPIAWGRVFVAVALMSALMGGAVARLAYHPRPASTAATARGPVVAPAPSAASSAPAP